MRNKIQTKLNVIAILLILSIILSMTGGLVLSVSAAQEDPVQTDEGQDTENQQESEHKIEISGDSGTDENVGNTGPSSQQQTGEEDEGKAEDEGNTPDPDKGQEKEPGQPAGQGNSSEPAENMDPDTVDRENGETGSDEGKMTGEGTEDGEETGEENGEEAEEEAEEEEEPGPDVQITGDDNPNGKWNFTKYNIANHYWTTPLKIKDSNGNTTIAYCGAALMGGSRNESSFKDVWLAKDPNIIKCAYYSCGDGASLAQKYFSDGGGTGNKWRGGVILGHIAMSLYVQEVYPGRVPSKYKVDLNHWRDSGYVLGGANSSANTKLKAWFVKAVKAFMNDIESRPVPENVKVYLCQSGNSNHQIYYYIVKSEEPSVPVYHPDLSTRLTDEEDSKEIAAGKEVILKDEVTLMDFGGYAGKKIRISGELFDAETGQGTGITASEEFTVDDGDETVIIRFHADTSRLAGRKLVASQSAWDGDTLIVEHKDLTDPEQTVTVPDLSTHASSAATDSVQLPAGREQTIVEDVVHYRNLDPDRTYRLTGRLICRETGEEVPSTLLDENGQETDVVSFSPESPDGSCTLRFAVDTRQLEGCTLVTFERLYASEKLLITHENPDDEAQTVYVPSIATEAADARTGNKTLRDVKEGGIRDLVQYCNLIPGESYLLSARLINKETRETAGAGGEVITGQLVFTPETADGEVEVLLPFDVTALKEGSYVVFETLYLAEKPEEPVAVHEDPEDEDQTVWVPERPEPSKPRKSVPTGDQSGIPVAAAFLLSGGTLAGMVRGKSGRESKK